LAPLVRSSRYPDPGGCGQLYSDGQIWTGHIAQSPQPSSPARQASAGEWAGSVLLLAHLLPRIGLVAGLVYVAKGDGRRRVGLVTIARSSVALFAWIALMSEPATGYGY
jgi:hypothetical protein